MGPAVAVIGGANTDVIGFAGAPLRPGDSTPGSVRIGSGGVGRNIAENLARLGCDVRLITAVGQGVDADALVAECRHLGIDVRPIVVPGAPCPRYVCILDEEGRPVAAVSDMRAAESMSPDALASAASAVDGADLVILDTNISEEALAWACERWKERPLMLDPVSVAKASRATAVLGRLHTLKANAAEAAVLVGEPLGDAAALADALHAHGVRHAIVTDATSGVAYAGAGTRVRFAAPPARVVNATGAGDAFMAGIAYGFVQRFDTLLSLAFASAMAALALESERTVSHRINRDVVMQMAEAMLG